MYIYIFYLLALSNVRLSITPNPANVGQGVILICAGDSELTIPIWIFQKNLISLQQGASNTLSISSVTVSDAGSYTCEAFNPATSSFLASPPQVLTVSTSK